VDEAANEKDLAAVIDRLYWVALSRPASSKEQKLGEEFLKRDKLEPGTEAKETNRAPVGDVLWALFACPEFQYIR